MKHEYRVRRPDGTFVGAPGYSWFTIEEAREIVKHEGGTILLWGEIETL